MNERVVALVVASALACGCRPDAPPREDPLDRAGDAGYVYAPIDVGSASTSFPAREAGARPALEIVAGLAGSRGDLDGTAGEARLGLVVGMARIGDAIVFADQGTGALRKFTPLTGAVETLVRFESRADGTPSLPAYVAWDGAHTVYVSDRNAELVRAVDLDSRSSTTLAGKVGLRGEQDGTFADATFDTPTGIAFDGDHTLWIGDVGNRHIRRLDLKTKTVATSAATFSQPWGLCFADGALYTVDLITEALFRLDARADTATVVVGSNRFGYSGFTDGPLGEGRLHGPRGVACTADTVFVAERSGLVRAWDVHAQRLTTLAGMPDMFGWRDGDAKHALFADLQSVLRWDDDTVYLGDEASIRKLSLRSHTMSTVAGTPDQGNIDLERLERNVLIRPKSVIASTADDAAFIADCGTGSIKRVDLSSGHARTFVGDPAAPRGFKDAFGADARMGCPSGLTADARGNLFVGDSDNHAVRGIGIASASVVTLAGTPSKCGNDDGPFATATFCDPSGLAFGDGAVFVADASTSTIRKIDLGARRVTTIAGAAFQRGNADGGPGVARFASPVALAFRDGMLYVADRDNDSLRTIDLRTLAVSTLAPRFSRPRAIAFAESGDLLVADRHAVHRVLLQTGVATPIVSVGGGLRLGTVAPRIHDPVSVAALGTGDVLVLDGTENALVRLAY